MQHELERIGQLADEQESFYSNLQAASPLNTQFQLWKKNLFIPLTDQLEEQAQRKLEQRERKKYAEANKEQAFFVPDGADELHDIDAQRKTNERKQAILRQKIAQEKGIPDSEIDFVKPEPGNEGDPYKDTVDQLPIKRKQKWRLW